MSLKIDAGHTDQKGGYGCYLRIRLLTYPHDPSGCAFPLPCWACWAPIRVLRPTLRPWTPIRYGCDALLILAFSLASAPVAGALYLVIIVGSFAPLLVGPGQTFQAIPNPGADQDRGPDSSARSLARAIPWELVLLMACYALLYRVLQNFDCRAAVLTPVVRAVVTFAVAAALGLYLRGGRPDAPPSRNALPVWPCGGGASAHPVFGRNGRGDRFGHRELVLATLLLSAVDPSARPLP